MSEQAKGPDEIFCRSCGEPIKEEAEICPECGVRNQESSSNQSNSTKSAVGHDPSNYETTASSTWWYGVLGGTILWVFVFILAQVAPSGSTLLTLVGLLALIAWGLMPIGIFFDSKYVRANSQWNPSSAIYIIGSLVWLINIIVGAVYLYRRHESLGEP